MSKNLQIAPTAASLSSGLGELSARERSLVYAVLYGDLFDHALTTAEVERYRPALPDTEKPRSRPTTPHTRPLHGPSSTELIQGLIGKCLTQVGPYLCWRGREELVEIRLRRLRHASPKWQQAKRFARLLEHLPFFQMVGVCGSLALDNVESDGDIDLVIIASSGRLWIVHTLVMIAKRVAGGNAGPICPNFFLTDDHLAVTGHSMYRAREVAHVVPLSGKAAYQEFLTANTWIRAFLPDLDLSDRLDRIESVESEPPKYRLRAALEWLLNGRLGSMLDRILHRTLTRYFRRRWRPLLTTGTEVDDAYLRHRQEVVGGGYAHHIRGAFRRRLEQCLGDDDTIEADLEFLFPSHDSPQGIDSHFGELFARKYGAPNGAEAE